MRTLLERMVERTRNPEAATESALMPLVSPLYAAAPSIFQQGWPEERGNSERNPVETVKVAPPHVAAERLAAANPPAAVDRPGPQQAMPIQKNENVEPRVVSPRFDAKEIAVPRTVRRPAAEQALRPYNRIARTSEASSPETRVLDPAVSAPQAVAPDRPGPPSPSPEADLSVEARPAPTQPGPSNPVPVPARQASYRAVDFLAKAPANSPANSPAGISEKDPGAPVSQPQQITVSIGHIEVRAPQPPPAARTRRPEFRPSLSLTDFLRQSDGGRR